MPTKEWGNITWILFHTLAAQIKESNFSKSRNLLIEFVITTCNHLPCPVCTQDASNILKKANIQNIKTKENFIEFLRQFHNIVNLKLNNKTVSEDEIKNMYKKVHLVNIINNFIQLYAKPSGNMKLIIHSYQRQSYINKTVPILTNLIQQCGSE
jgi:hypothetical protein